MADPAFADQCALVCPAKETRLQFQRDLRHWRLCRGPYRVTTEAIEHGCEKSAIDAATSVDEILTGKI